MKKHEPPEWLENFCALHSLTYTYDPSGSPGHESWHVRKPRVAGFHLIIKPTTVHGYFNCTIEDATRALSQMHGGGL